MLRFVGNLTWTELCGEAITGKSLKQNEAQSARARSTHKGVNKRSKYVTQIQQQRPETLRHLSPGMRVNARYRNSTEVPLRMYLWWSLCTLYLQERQARVTVGDSGLRCCTRVTYLERQLAPLCVDLSRAKFLLAFAIVQGIGFPSLLTDSSAWGYLCGPQKTKTIMIDQHTYGRPSRARLCACPDISPDSNFLQILQNKVFQRSPPCAYIYFCTHAKRSHNGRIL